MKKQEQKQAQLKVRYYVYRSDFENRSIFLIAVIDRSETNTDFLRYPVSF